jgi:hypothetical protein
VLAEETFEIEHQPRVAKLDRSDPVGPSLPVRASASVSSITVFWRLSGTRYLYRPAAEKPRQSQDSEGLFAPSSERTQKSGFSDCGIG